MGGPTIGGMGRDAGGAGSTADNEEESADQVHPPVNVEVQGIIYIYNPPPAQEAGKAEGENNGPTAPAAPAPAGSASPAPSGTATAPANSASPAPSGAAAVPANNANPVPVPSGAATAPAAATPTNPQTKPSGGRP